MANFRCPLRCVDRRSFDRNAESSSRVRARTFATARLIDSLSNFGSFYAGSVSR